MNKDNFPRLMHIRHNVWDKWETVVALHYECDDYHNKHYIIFSDYCTMEEYEPVLKDNLTINLYRARYFKEIDEDYRVYENEDAVFTFFNRLPYLTYMNNSYDRSDFLTFDGLYDLIQTYVNPKKYKAFINVDCDNIDPNIINVQVTISGHPDNDFYQIWNFSLITYKSIECQGEDFMKFVYEVFVSDKFRLVKD